jgi:hypothetical protein
MLMLQKRLVFDNSKSREEVRTLEEVLSRSIYRMLGARACFSEFYLADWNDFHLDVSTDS